MIQHVPRSFIHTRPSEPFTNALKFPISSPQFYGPTLTPSKLLSANFPETVAPPSSPLRLGPSIKEEFSRSPSLDTENIFLGDERDTSLTPFDLSYEDFNTSFSSQASASFLSAEEEMGGCSFAEFFNLDTNGESGRSLGLELVTSHVFEDHSIA